LQRLVNQTGNFDIENINFISLGPSHIPMPPVKETREPRTISDITIGALSTQHSEIFYVDGFSVENKKLNLKVKTINRSISTEHEGKSHLILELNKNTIQFMELDSILNDDELNIF